MFLRGLRWGKINRLKGKKLMIKHIRYDPYKMFDPVILKMKGQPFVLAQQTGDLSHVCSITVFQSCKFCLWL